MVKLEHRPYNPLLKMKSISSSVLNALGNETAIDYILRYHKSHETGEVKYSTDKGDVKVYSDNDYIYLVWA